MEKTKENIKNLEFKITELEEVLKDKERHIDKLEEIINQIRSLIFEG